MNRYHLLDMWGASKPVNNQCVALCGFKFDRGVTVPGKAAHDNVCKNCVTVAKSRKQNPRKYSPINCQATAEEFAKACGDTP